MGESKQSEKTQRKRKRSPRLDGVGKKASHFDKEIPRRKNNAPGMAEVMVQKNVSEVS